MHPVPSKSPPNSVIKSTSESTIRVSWEPINQANVHGILLGYEVRYAKDDGSSSLTWKTKTLDADIHEIVLSDLEYFTRYKVVVCARTSKGCGIEHSNIAYTYGDGKWQLCTNQWEGHRFESCWEHSDFSYSEYACVTDRKTS